MTQPISPLQDRRQNALEAFWDPENGNTEQRAEEAIEVATRVKITEDVERAFDIAYMPCCRTCSDRPGGLKAAFQAAGFEVVE